MERRRTFAEEIRYREIMSTVTDITWPPVVGAERVRLESLRVCFTPVMPNQIRPSNIVVEEIRRIRDGAAPWWENEVMLPPEVAVTAAQNRRVRVRINRNTYGWEIGWHVGDLTPELPSVAILKSMLPPEHKHFLPGRVRRHRSTQNYLKDALSAGLPANVLCDTLKAWLMATVDLPTTAEADSVLDSHTEALLRAQPATLEVAGRVYKLVPCGAVDTRPLIARVRGKALSLATAEGEVIKTKARVDAGMVIRDAEARSTRMQQEAAERLRAASRTCPQWVLDSGRPHYLDGERWYVLMNVKCKVRDIRYTVGAWNYTVLHWRPIVVAGLEGGHYDYNLMPLWFRLSESGGWSKDDVTASPLTCTHIEKFMCMDLTPKPARVSSFEELQALEKAISRGMQVVNLNSPLDRCVRRYWPDFRAQLPETVVRWLKGEITIVPIMVGHGRERRVETPEEFRARCPNITWDSVETIQEENQGVFNVTDPIPVAAPAIPNTAINELAQMIQTAQAATAVPMPPIPERER